MAGVKIFFEKVLTNETGRAIIRAQKTKGKEMEETKMAETIIDMEAARELVLYIENDSFLYFNHIIPYIKCLHKKRIRGTYDPEKAVPGWERIVTEGAKKYERNFLNVRYYRVFNKATREEAARQLQEFFLELVYEGVYEWL